MNAPTERFDHVDYNVLDRAKNAFIEASRRTLDFARGYGFVPNRALGASANIFSLDLSPFLSGSQRSLSLSLIPEGLGTADDARPEDLTREELLRFWYNIGIKTISVLTNDAASGGLQTVLLGLYLPSSTPEVVFSEEFMKGFLDGIVDGCKTVGCVYFSGETPQLKNKIVPGKLDIAGAVFGLLPPETSGINAKAFGVGNEIVLVESSGPHENGFTTLRALAEKLPNGYRTDIGGGVQYWEGLNAPSKLYTPLVQALFKAGICPTNLENITGHGWQKIMRSGAPLRYRLRAIPPRLPIFTFVQKALSMSDAEILTVFNCGAGFAIFVESRAEAEKVVALAASLGLNSVHAGSIESAPSREVVVEPLGVTLRGEDFNLRK